MTVTEALAHARTRLGLTQAQAAGLLGTSQANISAYERRRLHAGRDLSERIAALADLPVSSAYAQGWPGTLASTTAELRADLRTQQQDVDMLRHVIQAADDFARLEVEEDRGFFLASPGSTGSSRWDALIAALAVELCRRGGLDRTPSWTRQPGRYLDHTWWVGAAGEVPSLRALILRDSPSAFRARGVMLGRQLLASA